MAPIDVLEDPRTDVAASAQKKYRVQLDFAAEDFDEINALVEKLKLPTRAELFRSALITLRWMYNKKLRGYSILAVSPDQQRQIEPEFTFLERVGPQYLANEPAQPRGSGKEGLSAQT